MSNLKNTQLLIHSSYKPYISEVKKAFDSLKKFLASKYEKENDFGRFQCRSKTTNLL